MSFVRIFRKEDSIQSDKFKRETSKGCMNKRKRRKIKYSENIMYSCMKMEK
jgi:hypothetical protein